MISRAWKFYAVNACFKEQGKGGPWPDLAPEMIAQHAASALPGFEALIARLPTPIVTQTASVLDIYQANFGGKTIRVYPPFRIDAKEETAGAFRCSWIPEGNKRIERYTMVSSTATLGFTVTLSIGPDTFFCEALRLDFEVGADLERFLRFLIENIGQHTHQWWLRSRGQPFRTTGRLQCEFRL